MALFARHFGFFCLVASILHAAFSFTVPSKILTSPQSRSIQNIHSDHSSPQGRVDRRQNVQLFYSSDSANNPSPASTDVLYQQVIRPSATLPDFLFLGYLVEYLESHFKLPHDLPMIYDTSLPEGEGKNFVLAWDSPLSPSKEATRMEVEVVGIFTDNMGGKGDSKSATPTAPNMAMVVVKKAKQQASSALPPMMKNLFDDSETKILKALDLGLQDFVSGKIEFADEEAAKEKQKKNANIPANVQTAEEAIALEEALEVELVDKIPERKNSGLSGEDVILDASVVNEDKVPTKSVEKKKKANPVTNKSVTVESSSSSSKPKSVQKPSSNKTDVPTTTTKANTSAKTKASVVNKKESSGPEDFAIAAARNVAKKKKKKKTKQPPTEDFAVAAARKVKAEDFAVAMARKVKAANKNKKVKKVRITKKKSSTIEPQGVTSYMKNVAPPPKFDGGVQSSFRNVAPPPPDVQADPNGINLGTFRASDDDYMGNNRAFKQTISRPRGKRSKLSKNQNTKNSSKKTNTEAKTKVKGSSRPSVPPKEEKEITSTPPVQKDEDVGIDTPESTELMNEIKEKIQKERKLNVNVVAEEGGPYSAGNAESSSNSTTANKSSDPPSQEDMEIEVMKAAQKVMKEMTDQQEDVSPEELLQDILKFGEEKEQEEKPGHGFVSGAFEKAKDLLRERHAQRQERLKKQTRFKERTQELNDLRPNIVDPYDEEQNEMTDEEELRQMFEAGEKIADGRITTSTKAELAQATKPEAAEEEFDRLVSEDKSISSHARVLDDELVELELSINKSPGEELDGPAKNPMFDVMSGPEVYNPNVEPDTVNYPGAIPGTKEVRLPKDLDEAVKQSKFAAHVLTNLRTENVTDAEGTTREQYFMGKKEMSNEQIEGLRKVVVEAVQIGLIQDPLLIAEERARLQMLLDELWNQPAERFSDIASEYKDLLLSENFVGLVRERLRNMAERDLDALRQDDESLREPHEREREIMGHLVNFAQLLLKEARALGAELEAQQLEVIRSICKVAMNPAHTTEEETAMALSDAVRDMRPLLDDMFVAYLKYAVAEEEARLARQGVLDDPAHNQWLFVLKIVQQGVYAEVAKTINRYIDHIGYVLRMNTQKQRRELLSRLIDDMPTMDVRPFVQVVENIAGSLGDAARGEFDGVDALGEKTNVILQLRRDVHELLPPERIAVKARDADEWAARQREKLMEARNATKKRLQAARETEHLAEEVARIGRQGEIDRFD